jgi:hypothetical protein
MEFVNENNSANKRPQLLSVVAILSFIGSGLSFISYLMMSLYYHYFLDIMNTNVAEVYKQMGIEPDMIIDFFKNAGRPFFILSMLAYAGSLFGVYKMWNLQKVGLHYYAISQLIVLLLPLVFVSPQLSVVPGLLLTITFVLLYNRSFKLIEAKEKN